MADRIAGVLLDHRRRSAAARPLCHRRGAIASGAIASGAIAGAAIASRQSPAVASPQDKPTRPKTIDEQLLQGLPGASKPSQTDAAPPPAGEDLGAAGNPLERIANRMRVVRERLETRDLADKTQQLQQDIVADLDRLIRQAQQQQPQNPPPTQPGDDDATATAAPAPPPAGAPGADPETRPGEPGASQPKPPGDAPGGSAGQGAAPGTTGQGPNRLQSSAWWGSLPPQMREQLRRSESEQFLPKYEKLIESYYRRLAEDW